MDLHSLVEASIKDTVASLWPPFAPELLLCASILCLLLIRFFPFGKFLDAGYLTIFGLTLALYVGAPWTTISSVEMGRRSPEELVDSNASLLNDPTITPTELFGGMIVYDTFTVSIRAILLFFTIIFVVFTKFSSTG